MVAVLGGEFSPFCVEKKGAPNNINKGLKNRPKIARFLN
jgi:hypothetical protein